MSRLQPFLDALTDERINAIARTGDLGTAMDFSSMEENLRRVRTILREAVAFEDEIPESDLNQAVSHLEAIERNVQAAEAFEPTASSNPVGERDSWISQVKSYREQLSALRRFAPTSTELLEVLDDYRAQLNEQKKVTEAQERQLSATRQGQLDAATDTAGAYFEDQATGYLGAAKQWLLAVVGLSVVLVVLVLAGTWLTIDLGPLDSDTLIPVITTKITIGLVLSFGIGFSARNYRVNRHLAVLNKTKAVTLSVADRYAASVGENDRHRDIVVEQLVRAVFALGDTGYLPVDTERTIIESPGATSLIAAAPKAGSGA